VLSDTNRTRRRTKSGESARVSAPSPGLLWNHRRRGDCGRGRVRRDGLDLSRIGYCKTDGTPHLGWGCRTIRSADLFHDRRDFRWSSGARHRDRYRLPNAASSFHLVNSPSLSIRAVVPVEVPASAGAFFGFPGFSPDSKKAGLLTSHFLPPLVQNTDSKAKRALIRLSRCAEYPRVELVASQEVWSLTTWLLAFVGRTFQSVW
jgi:hypothetical protein